MRRIGLVAQHEFTETFRSRTFLIGLVLTPIIFAAAAFVPTLLSRSFTPTRYVAVVDQTGRYADRLAEEVARIRARQELATINAHVRAFAPEELRTDGAELDPAKVPALYFKRSRSLTSADLDAYLARGGQDAALEAMRPYLRQGAPDPSFEPYPLALVPLPDGIDPQQAPEALVEALTPYLEGEKTIAVEGEAEPQELHAALILPRAFGPADTDSYLIVGKGDPLATAQLWSENPPEEDVDSDLHQALDMLIRRDATGLPEAQAIEQLSVGAPYDVRLTSKADGGSATARDFIEKNLPNILAFALVFMLLGSLVLLMTNTMEEKSNRIIEVLMSSITPNELLAGKLLGAAGIALVQLVFTVVALLGIMSLASEGVIASLADSLIAIFLGSPILIWLLFYFVTAYFMFAGLFTAIGSLCENTKEMQSISLPLQYFLIFSPIVIWAVASEPNGTLARVLSYIPLTSPMMMMARINAEPGVVEILLTAIVQILGIAGLLWLSAKVFKVGALRSGKPPKLKELFAAVRGQA